MPLKVAVTTSSFGQQEILKKKGLECVLNPWGRTLKTNEIVGIVKECRGVIAGTETYDREVLAGLPQLRVISRCGVGTDTIDLKAAEEFNIKVFNTPDAPTRAVAELVIAFMFDLLRGVSLMDRRMRQGAWEKKMGSLIGGKVLGVIGMGRVGRAVTELAVALGMTVCYYDAFARLKLPHAEFMDFEKLLSVADILTIHVPLTNTTGGLLDAKEFSVMKKGVYVINCSRGGVVREDALIQALNTKHVAGAAVDVFEQEPYSGPLCQLDNTIVTPHIGSYAREARILMEQEAARNLIRGLSEAEMI